MFTNRTNIITLIIITVVLIAVGFFAITLSMQKSDSGSEAERVLENTNTTNGFTDLNGNSFSFEEHRGKVRVVNAWASWCPFCIKELPDFAALAGAFDDSEVVVVAVNRKESDALARAFVGQLSSSGGIIFVQDPSDSFYKSIGGFSMPETVFYDKKGNVSFHKRGFMTLEEMKERTQTALDATNTD